MLAPIYGELNRRKAIVYTHPKDNYCCRDVIPGVGSATIEYGTDTTRAIQSLLVSGTAAKYPEVRFIFSHGGGTAPYLISRMAGNYVSFLREGGKLRRRAGSTRYGCVTQRAVVRNAKVLLRHRERRKSGVVGGT